MNVFVRQISRLNWITAVVIPSAVILMEVYWLYPWFIWIGKIDIFSRPGPPLSIWGVIFLLGGGFVATRYLFSREWSLNWTRWGIIVCGLIVVFTVIRSEYHAGYGLFDMQWFVHTVKPLLDFHHNPLMIALPASAYLWWRGIRRGRAPLYTSDIYRTFVIGTISFVLLVIVWSISLGTGSLEDLASDIAPYVAAFFFFALVSMALINLQSIRQRMTPEDVGQSFNRRWFPILILVVGGIVLVGIGIASAFSPEFMAFLSRLAGSIGDVFSTIIGYIFIPIGFVVAALYWVGLFFINLVLGKGIPEFEGPELVTVEEEAEESAQSLSVPEVVILALKWALFAIIVIVIIYLLTRAIRRFRISRAKTDVTEVNESLWSWGAFAADVRLFLSAIWQRLWRRKKEITPDDVATHRYPAEEEEGTMGIREIYRRLLWQAALFGMGRRTYETPYEYRGRLGQLAPDGQEPLTEITDLYVNARYGEVEAERGQVDRANGLWQTLKGILRPSSPRRSTTPEK